MGQSESSAAAAPVKIEPFNPVVEIVKNKHFDTHYGEIKIVRDTKTEQSYILKEVIVNTKQAFETEVEAYKNRIALKSPHVVNIIGYSTQEKSNFCSTSYRISIYIEVLEKTLENELQERQKENAFYTENELLLIADSLISGLSSFQAQGFSHDDIRPSNIFVQDKSYKLTDPFLNAQKDSNGLTFAIINGTKTPLAPELIPQVPKGQFEITCDRNTADVYSLGVTLLSLGTLTNLEELYDHKEGKIDQTLLEERTNDLKRRYSPFTTDLIESMLLVETEKRPNFASLSNTLLPYQAIIRERGVLPFAHFVSGETVKRAQYVDGEDDLEARIKAALARSAETYKAISGHEGNVVETSTYTYSTPATYTYTPATYYNVPTDRVIEVTTTKETEVRSSVPQDVTTSQPGHYTDLATLKTSGYLNYNEKPVEVTTTTKVQEYTVNPSTYTYTYNAEKVEEAPVKASVQEYTIPATTTTTTTTYTTSYNYGGVASDLGTAGSYNPGTTSYNYTYVPTTTTYIPGTGLAANEVTGTEGGNTYSYNYTSPYTGGATTTYSYTTNQVVESTNQEAERKEEVVPSNDVKVDA